jgi:hypothetical protein
VDPKFDLDAYAAIAGALAVARDREEFLAGHGLDEARWEEIDGHWQSILSAALDAASDAEGIPELLERYSAAFVAARAHALPDVMPFERFVEITRILQRDPAAAAGALRSELAAYARASDHWARTMAEDPVLAARFRDAIG